VEVTHALDGIGRDNPRKPPANTEIPRVGALDIACESVLDVDPGSTSVHVADPIEKPIASVR
jgi:hypothetical protein